MLNIIKNSNSKFIKNLIFDILMYFSLIFGLLIFEFFGIILNISAQIILYNFIIYLNILIFIKIIKSIINKKKVYIHE